MLGCFVFLPRPTGSIKTTKCCLSIRWYAHSWSTTLLRHSPGGTGLPTLSPTPSLFLRSRAVPSFSFQLHRRRLFFRPFIGGSPYSWAFASLPDNPRVKLLCPVGIALARYLSPFRLREGPLVVRHFSPPSFRFTAMGTKDFVVFAFIKLPLLINARRHLC